MKKKIKNSIIEVTEIKSLAISNDDEGKKKPTVPIVCCSRAGQSPRT